MPYIFVEELPEEVEEADVVERSELDSAITERDEARTQRDEAIERAVSAENDLAKQKEKYANTFLSKKPEKKEEPTLSKPVGLSNLFGL